MSSAASVVHYPKEIGSSELTFKRPNVADQGLVYRSTVPNTCLLVPETGMGIEADTQIIPRIMRLKNDRERLEMGETEWQENHSAGGDLGRHSGMGVQKMMCSSSTPRGLEETSSCPMYDPGADNGEGPQENR